MKAMRQWDRLLAMTVNSGHDDSAQLHTVETSFLRTRNHVLLAEDLGLHYPGPVPMQPVRVRIVSATERVIGACLVTHGFAVDPRTGKPAARQIVAVNIDVLQQAGGWFIDTMNSTKDFSCDGVKVAMPTW